MNSDPVPDAARPSAAATKPSVLVLGGTQMLGRDFVELTKDRAALTLANRNTRPDLFPEIPRIVFDRNVPASCAALNARAWDVVVDFSCYSCEQLWDVLAHVHYRKYVYVSTQSVFDERTLAARNYADPYFWYSFHKRQIETYVRHHMRGRNWFVVRPCAVTGAHDYTNRFEERDGKFYWRHDGSEATTGTVHVRAVSEALARLVFEADGYAEIDIG
jgi:nucleoside-diphosphate-sugar epimerase